MFTDYNIYTCGDHAVTISFGNEIAPGTNDKVLALFQRLKTLAIEGIRDIIPAYTTVTVVYDIQKIKQQTGKTAAEFIAEKIMEAVNVININQTYKPLIEIPVCYDTAFGIDLEQISLQKKLSIEKIIELHTSRTYRVYMLGFLPGFTYMGSVDERIATDRLTTPRTIIEAGSVGIAGDQTGIYPFDSPGGWNIIGRTPLAMFDATKENPCLLETGCLVKFVSISRAAFEQLRQS